MLLSSVTQKIAATYADYQHEGIELEARFGEYKYEQGEGFNKGRNKKSHFESGIDRQAFMRMQDFFLGKVRPVVTRSTDYSRNGIRRTIEIPLGIENAQPKEIWIEKRKLWNSPVCKYDTGPLTKCDDYGIRISMSHEINIKPVDNFTPNVTREKNRQSFILFNSAVRLDLTVVSMIEEGKAGPSIYEVEVELLDRTKVTIFSSAIKQMHLIVKDTLLAYTTAEKYSFINYFNRLLGSFNRNLDKLDHNLLVQARNVKLKDMVHGGLIGNKNTGYAVAHKADGLRKLIVFAPDGLWMVAPPYAMNKITSTPIGRFTGTVIEGEYIMENKRVHTIVADKPPAAKYWVLGYDCLAYIGDTNVQYQPYGVRMNHVLELAEIFKGDFFLTAKRFKTFTTPAEFNRVMAEMLRAQGSLPYKQDGFIFTPTDIEYMPLSNVWTQPKNPRFKPQQKPVHWLRQHERVLTRYSDVLKWKVKEDLTIDFLVRWFVSADNRVLQLYVNDDRGNLAIFSGSKYTQFDTNVGVDLTSPLTANIESDRIVEYGWDYIKELFVPRIIRHDKNKPNSLDAAVAIWEDIHRPIEPSTLRGEDQILLRRYHNRIKSALYSLSSGVLLDIGSGVGGDASKWHKYSTVISVEPDLQKLPELVRRIRNSGFMSSGVIPIVVSTNADVGTLTNIIDDVNVEISVGTYEGKTGKILIIATGGENSGMIGDNVRAFLGGIGKVDVVSLMLSLTFFWQSSQLVDALVNTIGTNIKTGGKIIFLTLDGDLVEQTFEPKFGTGPIVKQLQLSTANLTYDRSVNPPELHVDIPGTIVKDQTEWLVHLDDLRLRLSKYGFQLEEIHRADGEKFMSEAELTLTQMYTYGFFSVPQVNPQVVTASASSNSREDILQRQKQAEFARVEQERLNAQAEIETTQAQIEIEEVPSEPLIPIIPNEEEEQTENRLPTLPDDNVEILGCSWCNTEENSIVRIGCITDANSLLHAVLKAYYKPYQNANDRAFRILLAKTIRNTLAEFAPTPDIKDVLADVNKSILLSSDMLNYVANSLNINIVVVEVTNDTIKLVDEALDKTNQRQLSIVVTTHEVIGLLKVQTATKLIQTVYESVDGIYSVILNK